MPFCQKIRLLALAIIRQDNRIFLTQGYDSIKQQTFYRAMGGGVDFAENSLEGLKREFQEEIQAEITNIKYVGCLENIFTFSGQTGHEIIQLYECDFVDPKFYQLEKINFSEGERQKNALWIDIDKCKSGELRVVPEQFLDYI
ncbi:MAG: NUDIX hydrolase [Moorea sp. SIO2B7]|nr:NUDIX hydrolase [Moorena sp. SIO2B7]